MFFFDKTQATDNGHFQMYPMSAFPLNTDIVELGEEELTVVAYLTVLPHHMHGISLPDLRHKVS